MLSELIGTRSRSTRGLLTMSKRQTRASQEFIVKPPELLKREREQRQTRRTTPTPRTVLVGHPPSSRLRRMTTTSPDAQGTATTRWS